MKKEDFLFVWFFFSFIQFHTFFYILYVRNIPKTYKTFYTRNYSILLLGASECNYTTAHSKHYEKYKCQPSINKINIIGYLALYIYIYRARVCVCSVCFQHWSYTIDKIRQCTLGYNHTLRQYRWLTRSDKAREFSVLMLYNIIEYKTHFGLGLVN